MKLYQVDTPLPCDIEDCDNTNAVLIVRTDEGTTSAVCPTHVLSMSMMNSENAQFFGQEPLLGKEEMSMAGLLEAVRQKRNMPWLRRGMAIDVNGCEGRVVGGNAHNNIQVMFRGETCSRNCHPQWMTVYFDQAGSVIANYR